MIKQQKTQPFILKTIGANFYLKKSHSYFSQVQGQLALTGLPWCDFCVYLSDSNEMCVLAESILIQHDYWENKLRPKLKNFFFNYALPFIAVQAKTVESCSRNNEPLVFVVNHT